MDFDLVNRLTHEWLYNFIKTNWKVVETTGGSVSPRACLCVVCLTPSPFLQVLPLSWTLSPPASPSMMFYLSTKDQAVKSLKPWAKQIIFLLNCCYQIPFLMSEILTNCLHVFNNSALPVTKELPRLLSSLSPHPDKVYWDFFTAARTWLNF